MEFLNGIPATVGGAIRLNAGVGWPERIEIGAFVESVEVMDNAGRIKTLDKKAWNSATAILTLSRILSLRRYSGCLRKGRKISGLRCKSTGITG